MRVTAQPNVRAGSASEFPTMSTDIEPNSQSSWLFFAPFLGSRDLRP